MSYWNAVRSPTRGEPSAGIAATADAELAEPSAWLQLQWDDPDGYRTVAEVIEFIVSYAKTIAAPVQTHTTVTSVRHTEAGYLVRTDQGDWLCRAIVLASGACNIAQVPAFAGHAPSSINRLTAQDYRNPGRLADGGVLVVGASASGTQIANEIQRSGRPVILSVGEHIRAPRVYRGKDLQWWMDATGVLDERYDEVDDIVRARQVPSLQLAGTPDRIDPRPQRPDRNRRRGLLVVSAGITQNGKAQFAGSLRNMCALSDLKMGRLLDLIDEWARNNGLDGPSNRPTVCRRPVLRKRRRSASTLPRRNQDDYLGHRLPPRLFLARPTCSRPQGQAPA